MITNLFRLLLLAIATLVLAPRTESQSIKPQNKEKQLTTITDEYMHQMLAKTKNYTIVILKPTDKRKEPGADSIIWEHGRRNFALRADSLLSIICPITDNSEVSGLEIFNADVERTMNIMAGDPAVKAGIFQYEIHPCRSFPGDALPN